MGNTNSTPNNPENPDQNNENNNPDTPAVNSSSITEEEARFSNVYSLGGTRFEVDKQRFLFGDSTDLNLICKHSLNFYAANNAKNTGAGDAIKREKNKIKNKQIQQDKALKEALSKNSYLDNVQVNSLRNTPYTSNDSQVIVNPIHLLINIRRTSVRLVPKIDTKTKKPIPSIYKLNFIYDAMVTCSIKMDLYECLSDFNPNMTNTQPIMKVYRTEKLKSDVAVKFENFKDSPDLDMTEIMTSLKKLGTNKEGNGSSSSSSFYLIITIYRICQEARADKNFQEQTTFIHIDQVNEGLSKTDNWVIKSVRQICQVGKIQFFLQDIYGIENKKKLNKEKTAYETGGAATANLAAGIPGLDDTAGKSTNKDPQPDDEDTSCVVCLSEPRDTVMLPCRHLCMCSPCADKLRYQHGTCPFCRNPFQALLRIKAIKNGKTRREYSLADSLNGLQKEKKSKRKNKRSKDKDGKDGGGDANGHGKSGRGEISEEKLARARERKRKKEEKKRREKEGGSSKPETDTIEYEGTGFGVSSSKPKSTSKSKNENSKTRNKSPDPPKSKARSNANVKDAKDSKLNSKTRSDQKDDKNKNQSKSKSKSKSKKEKSPSPPPESDLSETDSGSIETDDDDNFNSAMSQTADFDSDTSMVNHTMGSLSDKDDFSDNEFKDLDGDGMSESRVTVQRNNKKR